MAAVPRGLRAVTAGLAGGAGLWIVAAGALDALGARDDAAPSDAIVVLGCSPRPDGAPSWCIERRAGEAARRWRDGLAPVVVTTGGGAAGMTEGGVAAAYLRRMGVAPDAVRAGEAAQSTRENALEALALVGPVRVLVVTDRPHAWRARRTFGALFPEVTVAPVTLPASARAWMALREVAATAWYAAQGWLAPASDRRGLGAANPARAGRGGSA